MRTRLIATFHLMLTTLASIPLQSQDKQQLFDSFIETIEKELTDQNNAEEIINYYINIYDNPINLNSCTSDELKSLNILTTAEIRSIIDYRSRSLPFQSPYELISIINIDRARFSNLYPFVEAGSKSLSYKKNRLEITGGYRSVIWAEGKQNISGNLAGLRYKLKGDFGKIRMGLALKKEPGEPLIWSIKNQWYYFEHVSGFVELNKLWKFKKIIVGNFTIGNGSGLIFSSGRVNSKAANPVLFSQQPNTGSKSFYSFLENSAFKGITSTISFNHFTFIPFLSLRLINGRMEENNISDVSDLTNINTSSLTIQRKKLQLLETGFSMISTLAIPIDVGINLIATRFDHTVKIDRNYYARIYPERNNISGSLFLTGQFSGINFWSEWAMNKKAYLNMVMGISFSLGYQSDLSLSYRRYTNGFFSFHSNPGSHFGNHTDEEGFYTALKLNPFKNTIINAYSDLVRSRQLRYQTKVPLNLLDSRVSIVYDFSKKHQFNLWVRRQIRLTPEDKSRPINKYSELSQNEYSIQFSTGDSFVTKTRIGIKSSMSGTSKRIGSFIYQQISIKKSAFNIIGRISLFEVDDFENRFYVYENDLTYSFNTNMIYRTGFKFFLLGKIKLNRIIKLEAKWSMTHYFNEDSILSSYYVINSPTRHEIAFQAIFKI